MPEYIIDNFDYVSGRLVRCSDCVHGNELTTDKRVWCEIHESVWEKNGFCSCGEQMKGEDNGKG